MWNLGQGTVLRHSQAHSSRPTARRGRPAHHRGQLALLLLVLGAPVLGAQTGPAQPIHGGRCPAGTPCRTVRITESTVSRPLGSLDGGPAVTFGATFGVVSPITPRLGAGAVIMLVVASDPFLAVAPRIRLHTSPNSAVDLTPGLIFAGDTEDVGRLWLDAGWMYKDRIGVGVQLGWVDRLTITDEYFQYQVVEKRPVIRTGLRLGSKVGGTGVLVQAGVVVAILVACIAGDGCGGW